LDKPIGPTSHDVVGRVRSLLHVRRIGHTGTLDPFASGLLLLCIGRATRLSEFLTGLDKTYRATFILGTRTTTHDPEGEVVATDQGWTEMPQDRIEEALTALRGTILQRPPAYSAKKVRGEAAYRKARRGETVELAPVEVRVERLDLVEMNLPSLELDIRCSSGTYVRALARDLGDELGVGAYVSELRRTGIGQFRVEQAVSFDDLAGGGGRVEWIAPAEALAHLPRLEVAREDARRLAQGARVPLVHPVPEGRPIVVVRGDTLIAVAAAEDGVLRPWKVFL
jgi:tRNA pseudouridine55 synthase